MENQVSPTVEDILTKESVVTTNEDGDIMDIKPKEVSLVERIIKPHTKVSRDVTSADIERVIEDGKVLQMLCYVKNGPYESAYAMAHPQIDDVDPLRYFVLADGAVIVNPKIVRQTRHPVDSEEGCMSYPDEKMMNVERSHKITVEYQTINVENKTLSDEISTAYLSGRMSKVFQHEIDHLDAKYIYNVK